MATIQEEAAKICTRLDEINTLIIKLGNERDLLKLANEALTDRLKRIETLAESVKASANGDLSNEGSWHRVAQIAGSSDG